MMILLWRRKYLEEKSKRRRFADEFVVADVAVVVTIIIKVVVIVDAYNRFKLWGVYWKTIYSASVEDYNTVTFWIYCPVLVF